MNKLDVGRRVLFILLAFVVGVAVALPIANWSRGASLNLMPNNQVTVDCSSELSVSVQNKQATVRCQAPGELVLQPNAAADQGAAVEQSASTDQGATAQGATAEQSTAEDQHDEADEAANTETASSTEDSSTASGASTPGNSKFIYDDALNSSWANWSWGSEIDFESKNARSGSAIEISYSEGWSALYLHSDVGIDTSGYTALRLWLNGGSNGGQLVRVCAQVKCDQPSDEIKVPANTWKQFDIPLSKLGAATRINEVVVQNFTPGSQPALLIDDVALIGNGTAATTAPAAASGEGPALAVDAGADQRAISPFIYGINFPSEALAKELRLPVARWGGNATTRYNWQNDTSNRASDWFFENIPNENANPSALPKGSSSDKFVEQNKRTGTASILTMPMIGWTPKSREVACGFSVEKFSNQQQVDPNRPCGNGLNKDGKPITGNDPADTSIRIGPEFVESWISYLKGEFGAADAGGVSFYSFDNEPSLWNATHRDVRPEPLSYKELRDLTYSYGAAIKKADPAAQTLGPVEWGWSSYFYSAKDQAEGGSWWNSAPDRKANGDTPLAAWYLQQMRAYEQEKGVRILDYFDLHYYPQSQGVALQGAGDEGTQALRLRSTRSLWDPSYSDESWIGEPVKLIPRMREWVDQNYPGTKLAISEYNWGGLESINGALAQADVLGIFGREGLDLATLWALTDDKDPGAFAFRIYRNYDGQGAQFGETSVRATSQDQEKLAVYAAKRASDGALTVIVINKTAQDLASTLAIQNAPNVKQAQVFRYSAANTSAIVKADATPVKDGALSSSFPANSITLLELR